MSDGFTAVMGAGRGSGRGDSERYGPHAAEVERLLALLRSPDVRRNAKRPECVKPMPGYRDAFARAMQAMKEEGMALQANCAHKDALGALDAKGPRQVDAGCAALSAVTVVCQRDVMSAEDIALLAAHGRQLLGDHPLLDFPAPQTVS